jgi:hypothetical protein
MEQQMMEFAHVVQEELGRMAAGVAERVPQNAIVPARQRTR